LFSSLALSLQQVLMYKLTMYLYGSKSVYKMDRAALTIDGLAEVELMQRAGNRVWHEINQRWPEIERITVFAGQGNNGGDAFVIALAAKSQAIEVQLICQGDLSRQSPASTTYRELWQRNGGEIQPWSGQEIVGELIVDGLLGIGLDRELDREWQQLIERINLCKLPKVAIDIPSGLNADTGMAQPCAVAADLTVTFIGAKTGQYLADGPDFCGELVLDDLGTSTTVARSQAPAVSILDSTNIELPAKRKRNTHKNNFGHILVIGGDSGMVGAASLAAQAALRCGAGMVTVLVHPDCVHSLSMVAELMVESWDSLEQKLALSTVVVVGPGLGQSHAANNCLEKLQACEKPMVVDASGLKVEFLQALTSKQVVITPHPGEAAGLLLQNSAKIQSDRLVASQQLIDKYGVVSVLKGSGSLVQQAGDLPALNTRGNPGMAVAGMGDVLAGMIAGLMGQQMNAYEAAKSAVLLHALCAEAYSDEHDETGLIASDILQRLPQVIRATRLLQNP
jgi:hydroxyethylthiazole kinase-like uncharacterized protein yjeF